MKTRISLIIATTILVFSTSLAWAGIDQKLLIGEWTGAVIVNYHGKKSAVRVEMTFHKDGKLAVKQVKSGKVDDVQFKVENDKISMSENGKKSYLTNVTLTEKNLSGTLEAAASGQTPPDIKLELQLTRQQMGEAKPEPKPEPEPNPTPEK